MSLVITTGTGSGKTESFLLPIMAKLAIEAQAHPPVLPDARHPRPIAVPNERSGE